jgi:GNAT superfamily N-acetyltransferase
MPIAVCLCGKRIEETGVDELEQAFMLHTAQDHADLKIPPARLAELALSIRRTGGWDGRGVALEDDVEFRPLSPETKEAYLTFFDGEALADNPVWASCYCFAYQFGGTQEEFEDRTGAQNRADKAALIERGEASGILAYAGGKVVGWCHVAPRDRLPALERTPEFAFDGDDRDRTAAIVCFVIAPAYRRQGLARRLLEGACDLMRDRGTRWLVAYPPLGVRSAPGSYHGRLSMYEAAGFERVRDAGRFALVRKAL